MLVVVPYTDLRPETHAAVRRWPEHEFVYVGGSDTAYAEILSALWTRGESFCLVEHDIVPLPGQLAELATCVHSYCSVPVALGPYSAPCLSLAKFDGSFLRAYPDAMRRVMRVRTNYGPPGHWRQLDTVLQQTVLARRYGRQPHCHLPVATHLNPVKSKLVPGAPVRTYCDTRFALPEPPEPDSRDHGGETAR